MGAALRGPASWGAVVSGTLFLIPTPLGETPAEAVLAPSALVTARTLGLYFVENARSARAFLKGIGHPRLLAELVMVEIGERAQAAPIEVALDRVAAGENAGVLSEAGCPGIADPGGAVVRGAHDRGVRVVPLVGPSAIVLALMASGLEGQRFTFHGYLPVDRATLEARIRALETASRRDLATQICIETPYRADRLLGALCASCAPDTRLCVAADLTLPTEHVRMQTIARWRERPVTLGKRPAVFLLLAEPPAEGERRPRR